MNNEIRAFLEKHNLQKNKITLKNKIRIINTDKGSFVLKKKQTNEANDVYKYLKSRSFDYFPNKIDTISDYNIYEYIEDIKEPNEQKVMDMVYLLSLLHSKTTFYKEVTEDEYKKIYEEIKDKIEYLYNHYNSLMEQIESSIYMAPSEYLIARNITKIYDSLAFAKINLEKWYEIVKEKRKLRVVNIHNNIKLDHYIKGDKPHFISWEKSKIDTPMNDLLTLYKNHYLDFEFSELIYLYESKYPLSKDESILLMIMLSLPEKIEIKGKEYQLCSEIRKKIDYLYKTENLVTEYFKAKKIIQ